MDYLDSLPGARVYDVALAAHAEIVTTTREAVQSTMTRHHDAFDKLSRI